MAQNLLIDTSVILEGSEEIISKLEKVAPVFVTDIVLQELDGHKNNANSSVAYRAREFFRRLGNSNGIELDVLPLSGMRLEKTDTLRKMFLGAIPLHVIVRKPYKSRDINDSKIIEVAKDYNMTLVTLDTAQRVRGLSDGVNAVTLEAILPQENIIERKEVMSEIEKMMKKTEAENKEKAKKRNTGIKLFFYLLAVAIILSFTPVNETMVFVIVVALLLMIPIFGEPMSNSEFEKKYGKSQESIHSNHHSYSSLDLDLRNDIVR